MKPAHHPDAKRPKGSTWGYYVTYKGRFMFQTFAALYGARHFLEAMIDGDEYTISDNILTTERGLKVRAEQPDGLKALEHKFTPEERDFRFSAPYNRMYYAFPRDNNWGQPIPDEDSTPRSKPAPKPKRTDTPAPKPKKESKPTGLTTVAEIAAQLKIDAKHARQALRKSNTPKPEHGQWAWPASEVDAIINTIKKHLK